MRAVDTSVWPARTFDERDAVRLIVDPDAVERLPETLARRQGVVPVAFAPISIAVPAGRRDGQSNEEVVAGARLLVAAVGADDPLLREPVRRAVPGEIALDWRSANAGFVAMALARCYPAPASLDAQVAQVTPVAEPAHAVALLDATLREACRAGASDIHLSPAGRCTRLRWRIDGRLAERARWPIDLHATLVQRLKVLAALDVAECRVPQDGRFTCLLAGRDIAFRVSAFPVEGGENVVLRIQDPGRRPASLAALGLPAVQLRALRALLARPAGLLLVAGPTGCGKTTTLYALLGELDDGSRNLVTLEDPVEYPLEGVVQAAVDPARRLDFASGARALLRQDPDVLMIGEIRDGASAAVALRAALAGHRVLASLHADDALGCVARLLDLGADTATLARCLSGAVAQRLLPHRDGQGRFAIVEVLSVDDALRVTLARCAAGGAEALHALERFGPQPRLKDCAQQLLGDGLIDVAGLQRVFGSQDATS